MRALQEAIIQTLATITSAFPPGKLRRIRDSPGKTMASDPSAVATLSSLPRDWKQPDTLLEKRKQCTLKGRTIFGIVQLIAQKMHIGAPTGRLATDSAKLEQWGGPVEHKQQTGRIRERFEPIPLEIFRLSLSALYSISTEIARNQRKSVHSDLYRDRVLEERTFSTLRNLAK